MEPSKILIPLLLFASTLGIAFMPSLFPSQPATTITVPTATTYSFLYTNTSVDFSVNSSVPAYLYIKGSLDNTSFTKKTTILTSTPTFSFTYPGKSFTFSVGLFTDSMQYSDIIFFIVNKTLYQPLPFTVQYSGSQFLNKTTVTLTSSTQLNLTTSTVDLKNTLTFLNTTPHSFLYQYQTTSNSSSLRLVDQYQRTMHKTLTFQSTTPNTNTTSDLVHFTFSYTISNKTTLSVYIYASEVSSAVVNLTSPVDSFSQQSTSNAYNHTIVFTNVTYTTYTGSITVYAGSSSLSKTFGVAINDTTLPVLTKYIITTGLTTIQANFTFSKEVSAVYYLTYPNTSIRTTIDSTFSSTKEKSYTVPIGVYNLSLGITDTFGNQNQYDFTAIKTQQLSAQSYLTVETNSSVITDQSMGLAFYPELVINQSRLLTNATLLINMSIDAIVFRTYTMPLGSSLTIQLPQAYLHLYSTSVVILDFYLPLYNLSAVKTLQYVQTTNLVVQSPALSLQSYTSNVTTNEIFALHLTSPAVFNVQTAYVDIYANELQYSLKPSSITLTNGILSNDIFIQLPASTVEYITVTVFVYYPSEYLEANASIRLHVTYGLDMDVPTVNKLTGTTLLQLNCSTPVSLEFYYGQTKNVLTSQMIANNYQSNFVVNLSSFLYQNVMNYYYFIITDSNGHSSTYDNASNMYSIFIPKTDFQAPYNTTKVVINQQGVMTFQTNEAVQVNVVCQDNAFLLAPFTCGNTTVYGITIQMQLMFPVTGLKYVITQVIMTDKAGNIAILTIDVPYQT